MFMVCSSTAASNVRPCAPSPWLVERRNKKPRLKRGFPIQRPPNMECPAALVAFLNLSISCLFSHIEIAIAIAAKTARPAIAKFQGEASYRKNAIKAAVKLAITTSTCRTNTSVTSSC